MVLVEVVSELLSPTVVFQGAVWTVRLNVGSQFFRRSAPYKAERNKHLAVGLGTMKKHSIEFSISIQLDM